MEIDVEKANEFVECVLSLDSIPTKSEDANIIAGIDFSSIKIPAKNIKMGRPRGDNKTVVEK